MFQISLSTMWSNRRFSHMAEFVKEAKEYGFTHFELNSILSAQTLVELLEIKGLPISSVHCPCPTIPLSNGPPSTRLQLSSLNRATRLQAVEYTIKTIELASKIGARSVVIHAGSVDVDGHLERDLHNLYKQGRASSDEFHRIKEKLIEGREIKAPPYLDAALESIQELLVYASTNNIVLGLENRYHTWEIPSFNETQQFLAEFKGQPIGYWHDVGHAEVQSRLGFTPHHTWLSHFSDSMIGIHLHDVDVLQDHCAPGAGTVDWDFIAQNIPKDIIRVCEIGEWNKREDAAQVVPFLIKKGILG